MKEYYNDGTVMQIESTNCIIINKGTIMKLCGKYNTINNYGTIMGGAEVSSPESNAEDINKLKLQIQQLQNLIKESENTRYVYELENRVIYLDTRCAELKNKLECLKKELENSNRTRLLEEIEKLKEHLKRSKNRERVSRNQQYDKGYQAGVVDGSNKKKEVFDWGVKPSREEAEALLSQLKIWLDCEDYGETPSP